MSKIQILPFIILIILPLLCSSSSIHDVLRSRGLPGGIFPRNVKSYTLDENNFLQVHFLEPCMATYENLVRFDKVVTANLSYGGLIGVHGLTQEELFLWLPVKDIIVNDPHSGVITFNIGYALKQLAFSLFEDPPICIPQSWYKIKMIGGNEKMGDEAQR